VSGGCGRPALVLCSHGTSDPSGQAAVSALVGAVRVRAGVEVLETWVDVQHPQVDEVVTRTVSQGFSPVTVVPLLLSGGYHVHVDVARAAAATGVRATAALGPDPRLADVLRQRLVEAGAGTADAVVVAAAGSSDARAVADVDAVVAALQEQWAGPVAAGFGSMASRRSRKPSRGHGPSTPAAGWWWPVTCWPRGSSTTAWPPPAPTWSPSRWCRCAPTGPWWTPVWWTSSWNVREPLDGWAPD